MTEKELLKPDEVIHIATIQFPNKNTLDQFINWLINQGEQDFSDFSWASDREDFKYEFNQPTDEPFLVME